MRDTNVTKKGIKFFILLTPIRLDNNNLAIKPSPDKALKFNKVFKYLRFGMK
jgi:hypothetical protein